jgi:NADPH-dependent curcumin reductase CurA
MAQEVRLRRLPGDRVRADDFVVVEAPAPRPAPGEVLVRNQWMSIDPYMRLILSSQEGFVGQKQPGDMLEGAAIGVVEQSADPAFPVGAIVRSNFGWRSHFAASPELLSPIPSGSVPLSWHLGLLGLTGITAWVGINEVLQPKAGEVVLVSGGSGAVGSLAVQLAKLNGARVLATCGSNEKAARLRQDHGVDAVMNYRTGSLADFLAAEAPEGVDCYFDNVGGEMLDCVLDFMKPHGRVGLCGAMSQYETANYRTGPRNFFAVIEKSLRLQGFNAFLVPGEESAGIVRQLEALALAGSIKVLETVVHGLENVPKAFEGLFSGEHQGKVVIEI